MSLIGQVTLINQNMHVASAMAADNIAREQISKETQKIINEEKELKVKEVRPVEQTEKILPEDDSKEEIERESRHIDLKA
ncbi:hypothetical protein C3L23_01170 [Nautilia sp. PV-1]|uniref:hypothetical protein n=1 Tax=Nautilia sp. PV-1 TaxID=2579250 RepID=UPI000FD95349|nr:hypothetical protein [Nautilia sp. PV-1]AZV45926.1 hypothetical protein C3L23_01170 [Nautilia sp. PV-1]